jgi:hypothetical protein
LRRNPVPDDDDPQTWRMLSVSGKTGPVTEPHTEPDRPVYRVGRSVGRTIYRQVGADPSKGDHLIGVMDTRELAAQVVAALNAMAQGRLRQPGDRPEWEVLREAADEVERDGGTVLTATWAADVLRERATEAESRAGRQS